MVGFVIITTTVAINFAVTITICCYCYRFVAVVVAVTVAITVAIPTTTKSIIYYHLAMKQISYTKFSNVKNISISIFQL